MEVLRSEIDQSVNFVTDAPDGGKFEARFVRRVDDYFIVYLSSHTGCNRSCRFCHLTATGQTWFTGATLDDYKRQSNVVLDHYTAEVRKGVPPAKWVNFNWMARGEPLANDNLPGDWDTLYYLLWRSAAIVGGLEAKFHISTIMPAGLGLEDGLPWLVGEDITIYYSVYSTNEDFRKRWLPKAMPVDDAMEALALWQDQTGGNVVLHGPFIRGGNDKPSDVDGIVRAVAHSGLRVARYNQVVYNPPNEKSSEARQEVIERLLSRYEALGIQTKSVPRVGFDVSASCGMFVA